MRDAARADLIDKLSKRINGKVRTRKNGSVVKEGRADMADIGQWIDVRANRQLLNANTSTSVKGIGTDYDDDNGKI